MLEIDNPLRGFCKLKGFNSGARRPSRRQNDSFVFFFFLLTQPLPLFFLFFFFFSLASATNKTKQKPPTDNTNMAVKLPTKEQVLKYAPLALLAFGVLAWLVTLGGETFFDYFSFFHFFFSCLFFCRVRSRRHLSRSSLFLSLPLREPRNQRALSFVAGT